MLGRQVGTSLLRLPRCARLPVRSINNQQCHYDLAIRTIVPSAVRLYAQITPSRPGRPKKAVGEPSRPVKRAVKQAAKSPKEDAATQKVKENKKTVQQKKKKKTTKSAAKPKKKTLTEDEKAKQAERLAKRKATKMKAVEAANVRELKKIALTPPHVGHHTVYSMWLKDKVNGEKMRTSDFGERSRIFAEMQKQASAEFKQFTPAQLEVSALQRTLALTR